MNASKVRISGPFASHVKGLSSSLAAQGYTSLSIVNLVRLMAHVSRWLVDHGLAARDLTHQSVGEFLAHRKAGYTAFRSPRALQPILTYLQAAGVILPLEAPPAAPTPNDPLLHEYGRYLRQERSLAPATTTFYERIARMVLPADGNLRALTPAALTRFVLTSSRTHSVADTKYRVTALRSLLRYLYRAGHLASDLSGAIPAVAGWRLTALPKDIDGAMLTRLLGSCDRRTHLGRRAAAAILLMARLGLRVGEVAALRLDDIDWVASEVQIRGKGQRRDRLPLPWDVGAAVAGYVRWSRPHVADRTLFLRLRAPHGAVSCSGLKCLLHATCRRARLPKIGTHRLRHTAATQMLRHGSSLSAIAEVLRHRHVDTTAIYAKVDRVALRQLVQPWPGGAQ